MANEEQVPLRPASQGLLPQVAERNIPRSLDVAGECLLYDEHMIGVYLADALTEERSDLLLFDRNLQSLAKRNN